MKASRPDQKLTILNYVNSIFAFSITEIKSVDKNCFPDTFGYKNSEQVNYAYFSMRFEFTEILSNLYLEYKNM